MRLVNLGQRDLSLGLLKRQVGVEGSCNLNNLKKRKENKGIDIRLYNQSLVVINPLSSLTSFRKKNIVIFHTKICTIITL